jgi:cell division inhibitor SepF
MAGSMRKMAVYLGLVEDDDSYRDRYADDDADLDEQPVRRERRSNVRTSDRSGASEYRSVTVAEPPSSVRTFREERPTRERSSELFDDVPARSIAPSPTNGVDLYRITTIHPHTYNDARRIGEEFREGVPVIMNLTEMEDGDAKRIVDFAAGLVFGLHGTIERVTNKVFLLSPVNVDVAAEARAQLAQNGFFNQS